MSWGEELLGRALYFRSRRGGMGELLLLTGGLGRGWFGEGVEFDLCISKHIIGMVASLPLPGGFRLAFYTLDQRVDVVCGSIDFVPIECVGVGSCASIATPSTNENLTIIFR